MRKVNKERDSFEYISLGNSRVYYQTADLGLATALCCKNYILYTLDKQDPRKISFIFKRSSAILADADAYWSKDLDIKARDYFDTLRTLKNRIYSSE